LLIDEGGSIGRIDAHVVVVTITYALTQVMCPSEILCTDSFAGATSAPLPAMKAEDFLTNSL
jgi:hypothetical protein